MRRTKLMRVGRLKTLAACILGLCAATGVYADGPQDSNAPPAPAAQDQGDQYLIGAGDVLQIFVWRNPELSATAPVRPDGRISTPLVDNVMAAGKTPSQLARDMENVLAEYVRSPKVNIIVTQPVSTFSQVKVVGQVTHPQSIPFREGLTALDAILAAGGLGPFAAGNRAKIVRTENGKEIEIRVKLVSLMEKGDLKQNVPLKPGDVLVVPEALF